MDKRKVVRSAFAAAVGMVLVLSRAGGSELSQPTTGGSQKLGIGTSFGRWPDGTVPYVYNPTDRPTEFSDSSYTLGLVDRAMAEIEGVSGVHFQFQGIDSNAVILDGNDDVVTIGWADIGGSAGLAGPASACTAQDVVDIGYCPYHDGSVRLNNNSGYQWNQGDTTEMEYRFVEVLTHELLHLLGIGHSDDPISIMYADPYTNLSHVRDDDIDALQSLYGKPAVFKNPKLYSPPATGNAQILDSYISTEADIQTELTTVDDAETAAYAGLLWQVPGGHTDDLTVVAVDPDGYYYTQQLDDRDCAAPTNATCLFWLSVVRTEVLKTYPGIWTYYVIMNGGLVTSHNLNVATSPTHNEPPDARSAVDTSYGTAPLTVRTRLIVNGDPEGDAVDATWHIPTVGEIVLDSSHFPNGVGEDGRTVTFDTPGDYEIYTEVNDDSTRYGTPGSGAEGGPGFRDLFRRVIHVTDVPDDVVAISDVSGDAVPDFVTFRPAAKPRIRVLSGADGQALSAQGYFSKNWSPIALGAVIDADGNGVANDPAISVLATNRVTGSHFVQTRRLDNGLLLNEIPFFGPAWTPLDLVVINDTDGDGSPSDASIGVLAVNKAKGTILLRVKRFSDRSEIAKIRYLGKRWTALAAAVVLRAGAAPLVGVLATDPVKGRNVVQSRVLSNGALDRVIYFFNSKWVPQDLATLSDLNSDGNANDPAWLVLATFGDTGESRVQSRRVSNGHLLKTFRSLNAKWRGWRLTSSGDISGNLAEEVAVAGRKATTGSRVINVRDYALTKVTEQLHP